MILSLGVWLEGKNRFFDPNRKDQKCLLINWACQPIKRIPISAFPSLHKGSFMLKLCPVSTRNGEATQDCLDRNILTQEDGDKRFPIYERPHSVKLTRKARLPAGLTCAR